jgi:hypothetical protein
LENFSPLFSGLCGLCAFARDIPSFGCGSATLVVRKNPFMVRQAHHEGDGEGRSAIFSHDRLW